MADDPATAAAKKVQRRLDALERDYMERLLMIVDWYIAPLPAPHPVPQETD
jgi:hypothetical protein